MHTPLVIGIVLAATVACLGLSVFFGRAWWERRRDSEYLLAALLTLCLALIAGTECLLSWSLIDPDAPQYPELYLRMLALPGRFIPALLLHFALQYARVHNRWQLALPLYLLALPAAGLALAGGWWSAGENAQLRHLAGLEVHVLDLQLSTLAKFSYVQLPPVFAGVLYLLGRSYRSGQRESFTALGGVILLMLSYAHDILGASSGVILPLMPAGMLAMAYGVSLTLIARYGRLSTALEQRTGELNERTHELTASYEQLRDAQSELIKRQQLALVGELAAVIAHEVRNPLAIIGNAITSLGKRKVAAADRLLLLEIIEQEMQRLSRFVDQLIHYAHPSVPEYETVNLVGLIQRSMALLDERPDIHTSLAFDEAHQEAEADHQLLREAFDNILSNARQAMPQGGNVNVKLHATEWNGEAALQISICDDGEGMSETQQQLALTPFFTTRSTSTGLGLPVVARIIEAHHGRMTIDSRSGEGTCIHIDLPQQHPLQGAG